MEDQARRAVITALLENGMSAFRNGNKRAAAALGRAAQLFWSEDEMWIELWEGAHDPESLEATASEFNSLVPKAQA